MPAQKPEQKIAAYLTALRDPAALRDEELIAKLEGELDAAADPIARLELRQQIIDAKAPSIDRLEQAFVDVAKGWADKAGISGKALAAEGVDAAVLRRAGFKVGRGGRKSTATRRTTGKRVSSEEVVSSIPAKKQFTVKDLQEASGASPAVVRKVIGEQIDASRLEEVGADPNHTGPGRAPTLYRKK